MSEVYIAIGVILIGLLLSALYSGLETGLYTINKIRLDVRASSGAKSAKRLLTLINQPTRMLAVLLVCNNIANYVASYGVARLLEETSFDPWEAILINAVILIPLLFIFGEVLPKDLFRSNTDTWTYRWSAPLSWSDTALWWTGVVPIVSTIGKFASYVLGSEQSVKPSPQRRFGLLFKEGLEGGVLSNEQITLADRVLSLKQLTVQSEMIPWTRVQCIGAGISTTRRSSAIANTAHTRLPVVNTLGEAVGILPVLSALLDSDNKTANLMNEPLLFSPRTPVREALNKLRKHDSSMAIVINQNNKPLGIVTLKDLVEPIVGELAAW
jgi:putative hemolysin